MPRQLSPDQLNAVNLSTGYAAYLLELDVKSEPELDTIRLTTAPINVNIASETYIAGGNFLSFNSISETVDINTSEINVSLSGVSLSAIGLFRESAGDLVNRALRIYRLVVNKSWESTANPILIFQGQCMAANAAMSYNNGEGSAIITIRVANKFVFFGRSKISRTNVAEHQILYTGDKGFEYVADLSERQKNLKWSP